MVVAGTADICEFPASLPLALARSQLSAVTPSRLFAETCCVSVVSLAAAGGVGFRVVQRGDIVERGQTVMGLRGSDALYLHVTQVRSFFTCFALFGLTLGI